MTFQVNQLDLQSAQSVESVKTLYVMKSRPLKDDPVDGFFKSKPQHGQQRQDMFQEVRPHSQSSQVNIRWALFWWETKFKIVLYFTNFWTTTALLKKSQCYPSTHKWAQTFVRYISVNLAKYGQNPQGGVLHNRVNVSNICVSCHSSSLGLSRVISVDNWTLTNADVHWD